MTEISDAMNRPRPAAGWRIDLLIAIALFLASGVWATQFWNTWTARGGQPEFYQLYFEPAVMMACGRGFIISEHQPKPLEDFLWRRRDAFDCRDLPADLKLSRRYLYQGSWFYLETAVGWTWKVLGISWSGMGPLFGILFGVAIALAYAIFRLGMNMPLAIAGAFSLAVSPMHVLNLPHLRDYAKTPFMLALVLILGLIVTRPARRATLLMLAAAYGLVLGIGYGFRTDFLIALPVLPLVLFAWVEGGVTRNLGQKGLATALFLATFTAVAWPAISAVYDKGGCQWHVALLGLQSPFDAQLGVVPAPYDFGHEYEDAYVISTVQGYASRVRPGASPPPYCSHDYDIQSGEYLGHILATFPADFIVRAYASALRVPELPLTAMSAPMTGWAARLYQARAAVLRHMQGRGTYFVGAALLIVSAISLRLGAFVLFFILYFGGYPALQFQERHYFYLEFAAWWAFGFVAQQSLVALGALRHGVPDVIPLVKRLAAAVVFLAAAAGALSVVLSVGRWYQTRQARELLASYIAAPKVPVEDPGGALPNIAADAWPQYLEVDVSDAACGPNPSVTFQYAPIGGDADFTRTFTVEHGAGAAGVTRMFLPVFERFAGLRISDARAGCLAGAYRFTALRPFPILLGATLPPDWESIPLFQRLGT